jgi:predicted metal-binding membrane protein
VPAVIRRSRSMSIARGVPLFVVVYLAVWAAVGLAVYALYRPHGATAAGVVVLAAGIYELTPLKARCRRRCRTTTASREFSLACVGSSIGLMAAFVALGLMSVLWMVATAVVLLAQKIFPAQRAADVPVALALLALGVVALTSPALIPGLMPSM